MTADALKKYYKTKMNMYYEFANQCGSVAELLFKVEVYGSKWTKWDWIMFLSYLDYESGYDEGPDQAPSPFVVGYSQIPDQDGSSCSMKKLLNDILDTIDNGTELDHVFTNKTIIMNFITWLDNGYCTRKSGIYRILAHIFKKFPDMWAMNWMFIRHRGKFRHVERTHRLAEALPKMKNRNTRYFDSSAFLDDFIFKYWNGK